MQRSLLRSTSITLLLLATLISGCAAAFLPTKASAVTAADWRAGHIIDDTIFFNKDAMTVAQIQEFLNAKVPTCDRWHSSQNYSPPFTCLKEYRENITTHANNIGNPTANPSGSISAAQIIWNAAQTHGINPQVLIVTLQKEQGLVTDTWPVNIQYRSAMGYGCPDTAPCDDEYYGFYNQVENAAWQFKRYTTHPQNFNHRPFTTRFIQWSPNSACGGANVYLDNLATPALYNYTPYQPNWAALTAGYGTGDGCSAYGNRNFWKYFNDWFGSTNAGDTQVQLVTNLDISPSSSLIANEPVRARFTLRNNSNVPIHVGNMAVSLRRTSDGANFDFTPDVNVTIPAGGYYYYDKSAYLPAASYTGEIVNYRSSHGWSSNYPLSLHNGLDRDTSFTVQGPVKLITGLTVNTTTPFIGQNVTASFQIRNDNGSPVNMGLMAVVARGPNGENYDFPADTNVTIPANSTYTYSKTQALDKYGSYWFELTNYREGIGWNATSPPADTPLARTAIVTTQVNPKITSSLNLSPASPAIGQNVTASFQITNYADAPVSIGTMAVGGRGPAGQNVDFAPEAVTIPANSTYTYSKTQAFTGTGTHNFFILNNGNGMGWNTVYPAHNNGVVRTASTTVIQNPRLITSLSLSPSSPLVGEDVTATFQIRNDAEYSVDLGTMAVAVRGPNGTNVDFAPETNVTIAPHTTYTFSETKPFMQFGTHTAEIVNFRPGVGWSNAFPTSHSGSLVRKLNFTTSANPTVISGLTITPGSPTSGQSVTASFQVRNDGDVPINIGLMAVAVRGPSGQNMDYAPDTNITINPGATYTFSKSQSFSPTGQYHFSIVGLPPWGGWNTTYPARAGGVTNDRVITVSP